MRNINNDLPVQQQYRSTTPVKDDKAATSSKTSGVSTENRTASVSGVSNNTQVTIPSIYEQNKNRMILEQEMDKLMKVMMPDLGVKFRVHDSGQIITTVTNNDTKEVVREFPVEKILDIVYDMVQKLGIVTNIKV
ncbi:MAG: flagellar protein FlaG [Oscillospiraceae bacterium]|nr:flagellar protein FlaG [Oscillospiraceae bacterium]